MIYGHLWATDETRALFEDRGRTGLWLGILAALAEAQAELGLIPEAAAREIAGRMREPVDLEAVAGATRGTGHSTLGLIHVPEGLHPTPTGYDVMAATAQKIF